jgi:hypothetical protein
MVATLIWLSDKMLAIVIGFLVGGAAAYFALKHHSGGGFGMSAFSSKPTESFGPA